jgi:hypothetical protein
MKIELTPAQVDELKRLAKGRQSTFGASRARVQGNLHKSLLVRFLDDDGNEVDRDFATECEITEAGRAEYARLEAKK